MGMFGGGGGGGALGSVVSGGQKILHGDVAGGSKELFSSASGIGNTLSGTSKDAGVLGLGQFKAGGVDINDKAFTDTTKSDALKAQFAAQLAASQGRKGPTMTAANVGSANQMQAAGVNMAPQAQFRTQQYQLAQALQDQANGKGPSLAQSQLQAGTDRNIQQAMALQASQRGTNAGQGLRQVAQQTAQANQQQAQQSADLRMQEQMQARGQLGAVLDSGRGQDIGLAENQAGLQQQANQANMGAQNEMQLAQAQLQQQANANNQNASLQQTQLNDAQSQFFNKGISGVLDQQQAANMSLEKLKVDQATGLAGVNQKAYADASQKRGDFLGGLGQGAAAIAMMAGGGRVPQMADGGMVGPPAPSPTGDFLKSFSENLKKVQSTDTPNESGQQKAGKAAGMGLAKGAMALFGAADGAKVPGHADVPGDSLENDKVPVLTSPGEVIVPRSIAADEDKTIAFVRALRSSRLPTSPEEAQAEARLAKAFAMRAGRSA